jgi:hypothetical protein
MIAGQGALHFNPISHPALAAQIGRRAPGL